MHVCFCMAVFAVLVIFSCFGQVYYVPECIQLRPLFLRYYTISNYHQIYSYVRFAVAHTQIILYVYKNAIFAAFPLFSFQFIVVVILTIVIIIVLKLYSYCCVLSLNFTWHGIKVRVVYVCVGSMAKFEWNLKKKIYI